VKTKIGVTVEDGIWSAHDPAVPGVYGLGPSRKAALADLVEAKAALNEYVTTAAEDAADVRAADASMAEVLAGGRLYTQEEIDARYGLNRKKRAPSKRRRR
jgi:predicted RNase H-like HicB family nuclease